MDFQFTLEMKEGLLVATYLLGVAIRVIWPYALKYFREGATFNWRMITGEILAAVIGLFGILAAPDFIIELGLLGYFGAFVAGFGAAALGRNSQKTIDAAAKKGEFASG